MNTISKERRDAIRAAAEKATPGPWEVGPVDDTVVTHLGADGLRYEVAGIDGDYNSPDEWPTMEANAAHIANCDPQTILALLNALDAEGEPVAWQYRDKRVGSGEWSHAPDADFRAVLALHPQTYEVRPLYTRPTIPPGFRLVPVEPTEAVDYFGSLVGKARVAAEKAMRKYPQPNYITLKIAEEAGEVVRGCVHYAENRMEWSEVEGEIVQLLAMLIRLVTEGDEINGVLPPLMLAAAPEAK